MSFHNFKVVMWKNYRLKRYHWIVGVLELMLPVLLALVVVKLACPSLSGRSSNSKGHEVKIPPEVVAFDVSSSIDLAVGYAPANPAVDKFMKGIKNNWNNKLESFANNTELENFVANSSADEVLGIYFRKLKSNETLPEKLRYVLRERHSEFPNHTHAFLEGQVLLNEHFVNYVKKTKPKNGKTLIEKRSSDPEARRYGGKLRVEKFPKLEDITNLEYFIQIIFVTAVTTILIFSISLVADILEERNSGVKELMKITGIKEWMIWLCWFLYALPVSLISFTIVVFVALFCKVFLQIPFLFIWMFLVLYLIANVSLCIFFSSLFQNISVASISYFFHYLGAAFVHEYVLPRSILVACLIPINVFYLGVQQILFIEKNDIEFSWSTFTKPQNKDVETSLLYVFVMLTLDALLYAFLAYYAINVNPGKYGTPRSPFFLFEGLAELLSINQNVQSPSTAKPETRVNPKYFETPPSNLVKTIQIINLHKRFKSVHAVKGVNLTTYQGEITALLGHNGAGKTTTMSVLTGMTSPTSGSVYYKKMNVFKSMYEFRYRLGFCSQEGQLFPYLSVMDHLLFFGQLKRLSKTQAAQEAEEYLKIMNMSPQQDYTVRQLSGGMKRKLSLCIAMMGKAEVLIMDEPTSGMDTESRRSFWDTLMNLRKGRTMILSTHYMEEADALGDRIAIMDHGVIVCHGTSMFLKKAYDIGYELTVSKSRDNSTDITKLVQSALPSASVVSDSKQQIMYKLPLTETQRFSVLFQTLESALARLGIQHLGLTAALMEQVFFIAGGAAGPGPSSQKRTTQQTQYGTMTGYLLLLQQLWTTLKKKFLFTTRDGTNIFFKIVLPTVLSCIIIWTDYRKMESLEKPVRISLSAFSGKVVLYQEVGQNVPFKMAEQMEKYVTETNNVFMKVNGSLNMREVLASAAHEKPSTYESDYLSAYIVGLNETTVMFQQTGFSESPHNLPVSIDTYYNVLLRTLNSQYSIRMASHPVLVNPNNDTNAMVGCVQFVFSKSTVLYFFLVFGLFTTEILGYFSYFTSMERVDGFYHVQMMSRLSPFVYWLGTWVFDFIIFSISIGIRILLFRAIGNVAFLNEFNEAFHVLLFIFTLYGISGLLMIYMLSFFINTKDRSSIFFLINILVWCIFLIQTFILQYFLDYIWRSALMSCLTIVVMIMTFILPMCTFYFMIASFLIIFRDNSQCLYCVKSYKSICEAQLQKVPYINFSSMESLTTKSFFFTLNPLTIIMIGQIVVYLIVLFLIYTGIAGHLFESAKNLIFGTASTRKDDGDNDVLVERAKIRDFKKVAPKDAASISLLVNGLRKNYIKWFRSSTAVSDVSFMVDRGKCFGLLGVNGAGKTTTFKMLTTEIIPTLGDASIDGVKMSDDKRKYLSAAGYCSQTDCFIEQLTALEMLNLIASFRGVRARDREALIDRWISIVGLEEYKKRRCGDYSGGNKRKLCSAMALIGDPKVVFLDEPTSGVDPLARRNLHNVMAQSRASGQTVVLTSHSMEECEALCDKLTIMVSGVMKCIGSVQYLKKLYAQGFSALIKILDSPTAAAKVPELQQDIQKTFAPAPFILKDSHSGLLFYQISDTSLPWSVLFQKMESIKQRYPTVVEDYVLTDTSLEEVFISFAKSGK